jgi:hypothetical protein
MFKFEKYARIGLHGEPWGSDPLWQTKCTKMAVTSGEHSIFLWKK